MSSEWVSDCDEQDRYTGTDVQVHENLLKSFSSYCLRLRGQIRRKGKQTAWDLILRKLWCCAILSMGDMTTAVKNAAEISDYSKVKHRASELELTQSWITLVITIAVIITAQME